MQLPDLTTWERADVVDLRDRAANELVRRARLEAAPAQLADLLDQVHVDGGDPDDVTKQGKKLAKERKTERETAAVESTVEGVEA